MQIRLSDNNERCYKMFYHISIICNFSINSSKFRKCIIVWVNVHENTILTLWFHNTVLSYLVECFLVPAHRRGKRRAKYIYIYGYIIYIIINIIPRNVVCLYHQIKLFLNLCYIRVRKLGMAFA